jgi:uncharacterized protein YprB with RNaseH-like and TPR domain/predicted nuclease with RNAse H fold/dephospho-CoA kinase
MLRHTFIHLPGVGLKKESGLWNSGVLTWDDFEHVFLSEPSLFPRESDREVLRLLEQSRHAFLSGDSDFFAERLPINQHYRLALAEPHSTVFVDIETTGLSHYYDYTTLIGVADDAAYRLYVRGEDIQPIAEQLSSARCIVTFNGTMFDLKFLRKEFPNLRLPKAHVDLRYLGLPLGIRGTQKAIEQKLGFKRTVEAGAVRGETAPLLWHQYMRGDLDAGRQLAEYNRADIEGMRFIFDRVLSKIFETRGKLRKSFELPRFFAAPPRSARGDTRRSIVVTLYKGCVGPQITYEGLSLKSTPQLRVVGIDLTGSEKRASGWCLLDGRDAVTKLLKTDEELVRETAATKPHLVSIDSPLSLPRGRKKVSNDDPGRVKYGIMRECERTLKKRGVNVYPSLIDSMQNLTARGIRLAKRFRKMGIPVIESYPGAAQDIIGIPRKRMSMEYLNRGLGEFGLCGEFLERTVSHDELDAITAAVVGLFFWAGKFEALGNPDEEYLIVPDLSADARVWRSRISVGISGPIAAGKTTAARFLESKGFAYGRYSEVLAALLRKKGMEVNRKTLQEFGEKVHRKPGQRWLSRQLIESLPRDRALVIDGMRFPEDHAMMVESFGPAFLHIHVEASEAIRRERSIGGNPTEEFEASIRHPVEAKVSSLAALAYVRIVNESSPADFRFELRKSVEILP